MVLSTVGVVKIVCGGEYVVGFSDKMKLKMLAALAMSFANVATKKELEDYFEKKRLELKRKYKLK